MEISVSFLLAGVIFGLVGIALFRSGKKDAHFPSIFIGLALMVYPYFISNDWLLWGVGAALTFYGYYLRRSA